MPQSSWIKYISLFMALVMSTIAMTGCCRSAHGAEASIPICGEAASLDAAEKNCPTCPDHHHSDSDRCETSCNCSCHAPLMAQPVKLCTPPFLTTLVFFEPFKALPEVYLSRFIPPQNHA